jgi:polyhydroxybutyrate depolymerase
MTAQQERGGHRHGADDPARALLARRAGQRRLATGLASALRRPQAWAAFALAALAALAATWLDTGGPAANAAVSETMSGKTIVLPAGSSTHSMFVGARVRSWLEVVPPKGLTATTPIIIVLDGVDATPAGELVRDGFVDLAEDGEAELVYPAGVDESWDADGCCGPAGALKVNDVGFLEELATRLDPGHDRPLYLVGYSNGGRMAYTLESEDPSLFDAVAIVNADPQPGHEPTKPFDLIQLDGTADPILPYATGEKGHESPPATVESQKLRELERCSAVAGMTTKAGDLSLQSWTGCAGGARYEFASFTGAGHSWFAGNATTPSEAEVIWSFFERAAPKLDALIPTSTK